MRAIRAWLFLGTISLASALTCAQVGRAFQERGETSAQDRRAVAAADTFLLTIEQGRLDVAHGMLTREARAAFNPSQLAPRRALGRRGGFVRRYRSSADVSEVTAFQGWGRPLPGRFAYRIVCYVELPGRGLGAARYVSVIVRSANRDQVWFPLIYRIESSPSAHCPS